jgi:hypothetical protein
MPSSAIAASVVFAISTKPSASAPTWSWLEPLAQPPYIWDARYLLGAQTGVLLILLARPSTP